MKDELDLTNYATKTYSESETDTDALQFTKNNDLTSLRSTVDQLDIDKLKSVPTNLSNLKIKVDKLDIDKLVN